MLVDVEALLRPCFGMAVRSLLVCSPSVVLVVGSPEVVSAGGMVVWADEVVDSFSGCSLTRVCWYAKPVL